MRQVEGLKADLEEAERVAAAAVYRADAEAESAERQIAAAEELSSELARMLVCDLRVFLLFPSPCVGVCRSWMYPNNMIQHMLRL